MHTKAKRKASKAEQATFRDADVVAGAASQGKVQPIFCTLEELYSGCCKTCKVSDSGLSVDVNVPAGSRHGSTIVANEAGAGACACSAQLVAQRPYAPYSSARTSTIP
jgi:hypothetical protein